MSQTEEEASERGFVNVINRVWNALDVARRELSSQEDNILRSTRSTFRRRRRVDPTVVSQTPNAAHWRVKLFLLPNANAVVLPTPSECSKLTRQGLGVPKHDVPGPVARECFVPLSWTLTEFNNYICHSYPQVSLNVIGFNIAKADKARVLTKIQASTLKDLRKAVCRSRLYIIPHTSITLPQQVSETSLSTVPDTADELSSASSSSVSIASSSASGPADTAASPPLTQTDTAASPPLTRTDAAASPTLTQLPLASCSAASLAVPQSTSSHTMAMDIQQVIEGQSRGPQPMSYRNPATDFFIDSDEEEEDDDIVELPMERENLPLVEEDVAVLLKQFQEDNLSGLVQKICIRRRKLLDTAIRAMSRLSFSWNDSPEIEFFGEEADDMGGPQREFFRLLMIEVQSTLGIFEGRAGQVFFAYDQSALEQNKFFQGGKLIGWSLAHGGPGIKALDPNLYQMMCGQDPPLEHFNPSLLPDPDVQEKLKRVLQCQTCEDLSMLKRDLGEWIADCGFPGVFNAKLEEVPKIYSYVVKHYIFLRSTKMINQFTEGISSCGRLWDLIKCNWIAFLPIFTNMQEPMSKGAFKALYLYTYSGEKGTNVREAEEETAFNFEMILNKIEDKVTDLTYEDILIFMTGADEVPVLGFPTKPTIGFYSQEPGQRRLPYASTCQMCLYLPRDTSEEDLHDLLCESIKGSHGFGKV